MQLKTGEQAACLKLSTQEAEQKTQPENMFIELSFALRSTMQSFGQWPSDIMATVMGNVFGLFSKK